MQFAAQSAVVGVPVRATAGVVETKASTFKTLKLSAGPIGMYAAASVRREDAPQPRVTPVARPSHACRAPAARTSHARRTPVVCPSLAGACRSG